MRPLQQADAKRLPVKKACSADTIKHAPRSPNDFDAQESGVLSISSAHRALRAGQRISHYRLIEIVGEGSFGSYGKRKTLNSVAVSRSRYLSITMPPSVSRRGFFGRLARLPSSSTPPSLLFTMLAKKAMCYTSSASLSMGNRSKAS